MYHFYFNLPKNDKNAGTVFLPYKKIENIPVIVSCYGSDPSAWAKRAEEEFIKYAVNKHKTGVVTIALSEDENRWAENLNDMVQWVKERYFCDPDKVGLFACGAAAEAAHSVAEAGEAAFSVLTVQKNNIDLNNVKTPSLVLQGTAEKVVFQTSKFMVDTVIRVDYPETKSLRLTFEGSDYLLYSNIGQVSEEVMRWVACL
jgi:hypothetical protein